MLTNLIDNAVKYSPEGAPVEVRAAAVNGHATIEVVDAGTGIAPEDQTLIFEKFGRVRGTARSREPASASTSPARSPRRTAARSRSARDPGHGSTFALDLPIRTDD